LFADWFQNHFVPEVMKHRMYELRHEPKSAKALILLDNAPDQPSTDSLKSKNGKIKYMFLPPNTSSLIKPMDQGVILTCKRSYRRKKLDENYVFF
jgi:hypothetical protein